MENRDKLYLTAMITILVTFVGGWLLPSPLEKAQATGCPVDTIIPFIDDAIKSLEQGDTQTALSQMKDARNELSDTFEVED